MIRTLTIVALALASACNTAPPVTVVHVGAGAPANVHGDHVKIRRGSQAAYAGLRDGYFVVRDHADWRSVFESGREPPLPATLDTSRSMLLLAVADKAEAVSMHVDRVLETAELVHVWVSETTPGDGCVERAEKNPFDAVVVPRIEKPIKFYVSARPAEACGDPPAVSVTCRVGDAREWAPEVKAKPGDTIDCLLTAATRGRFAIVDRVLGVGELPGGSATKLAYTKAPTRGRFTIDVFGKYTVRGEATDDSGRKSTAVATVTALPPKSKDVRAELVWKNLRVLDEPDTFPRVTLHATQIAEKPGGKPKDCAVGAPVPTFCEAKAQSAYTHMTLAASDAQVPLSVSYTDERAPGGPLVCVQLYFDGASTGEICDDTHREAGASWEVGTVDMSTGTFVGHGGPGAADGGAPDGGAPDAGASP